MNAPGIEEKAAVLLNLLGAEATAGVMNLLPADQVQIIKRQMQALETEPPTREETRAALDDFEMLFRFAVASKSPEASEDDDDDAAGKGNRDDRDDSGPDIIKFDPSDDPMADLSRLSPLQIAGALTGEQPRMAALVINGLPSELAAEVIRLLPDELRSDAFLQLNQLPEQPSKQLLTRIARSTFDRAVTLDPTEFDKPDAEQKLADTLRAMEKKTRANMLEVLKNHDPEYAERIAALLYVFDDIERIENRSLQKLLAEVSSETLTTALSNASEAITDKILNNLSKRARANLQEELEFKGNVDEDDVTLARKEVAEIIGRLDQSGDLVMEE